MPRRNSTKRKMLRKPKNKKRPRSWHRKALVPLEVLVKELKVGVMG